MATSTNFKFDVHIAYIQYYMEIQNYVTVVEN